MSGHRGEHHLPAGGGSMTYRLALVLVAALLLSSCLYDPFGPRTEPCPDIVVYMTLDTTQVGHELVTDSVDYDPRCEP